MATVIVCHIRSCNTFIVTTDTDIFSPFFPFLSPPPAPPTSLSPRSPHFLDAKNDARFCPPWCLQRYDGVELSSFPHVTAQR